MLSGGEKRREAVARLGAKMRRAETDRVEAKGEGPVADRAADVRASGQDGIRFRVGTPEVPIEDAWLPRGSQTSTAFAGIGTPAARTAGAQSILSWSRTKNR